MRVLLALHSLAPSSQPIPIALNESSRAKDAASVAELVAQRLGRPVPPSGFRVYLSGEQLDPERPLVEVCAEDCVLHVISAPEGAVWPASGPCAPQPRVERCEPAQGLSTGGMAVRLVGSGFRRGAPMQVAFGGAVVPHAFHSDRLLVVTAPPHEPGVVSVRVRLLPAAGAGTGAPSSAPDPLPAAAAAPPGSEPASPPPSSRRPPPPPNRDARGTASASPARPAPAPSSPAAQAAAAPPFLAQLQADGLRAEAGPGPGAGAGPGAEEEGAALFTYIGLHALNGLMAVTNENCAALRSGVAAENCRPDLLPVRHFHRDGAV
eukprot:tig00001416_g8957.t1